MAQKKPFVGRERQPNGWRTTEEGFFLVMKAK
jgi:hypothetical protein